MGVFQGKQNDKRKNTQCVNASHLILLLTVALLI